MGPLHFEDFTVGDEYRPQGRTITEGDIVSYAGLSGDFNPVHLDAVHAASTRFGSRIAHGLLGLAVAGGLLSRVGVIDGTATALLGVAWRFVAPVRIGDTISAVITVAEARETSNPRYGIVTFAFLIANERAETVQEGTQTFLLLRRQAEPDPR